MRRSFPHLQLRQVEPCPVWSPGSAAGRSGLKLFPRLALSSLCQHQRQPHLAQGKLWCEGEMGFGT